MAEQAEQRNASPRRRDPAPQESVQRHALLERRAAAQPMAGYGVMLNARPPGPRPIQRKPEAPLVPCAPPIQRMILPVWSKDKDKTDFLDQGKKQSEKLGHGKVISLDNWWFDKNLSGLGDTEDLHIIGHGSPASIAGMTPDDLAEALIALKLPAAFGGQIYLEACESGSEIVDLKGSYAERFAAALAKLRPDAKRQPNLVAYKGAVVLDDTFKGHEMMRVLHKGVEMQAFKVTAAKAINAAQREANKLLEIIDKEKLKPFIDDSKIKQYHFLYYNQLISQLAEPAGGSLTQYVRGGKAEASSSVSLMDPDEFMAPILEKARKENAEIANIKIEYLDLSDLGPIIVDKKDQKQEKEKPKDIKQKPVESTETKLNV